MGVGVHAELLGAVNHIAYGGDVGDKGENRNDQVHVRVVHRLHREDGVIREHGNYLAEHAPQAQGVGAVLDPAALVPEEVGNRGGEQQRQAAVPRMGGQAVVGVAEVPNVIAQNENPRHVGPEHVLLLLGHVDAPPAGHDEDVQNAGNAIEDVVPAAVQRDAFAGNPRGAEGAHGAFEVAHYGDQDVNSHDDEWEALEPFGLAERSPVILQNKEADAARGCGVKLGIVEPAVHVEIRGVVERPLGARGSSRVNRDEVCGKNSWNHQEARDAADFRASRDFVEPDKGEEYDDPSNPLVYSGVAVNVEQHWMPPFFCCAGLRPAHPCAAADNSVGSRFARANWGASKRANSRGGLELLARIVLTGTL